MRNEYQLYPDYSAEIAELREKEISDRLLYQIIEKHLPNAEYNKELYKRYMVLNGEVPIFKREPRFHMENFDGNVPKPINNKINNDFFGEIIDFKVGYFAGKPFAYSYSDTDESEGDTGGEEAVKAAKKVLSDFVTLNNMYDVDMEITKNAAIYGYSGRLLYHDYDGEERVMSVHGFETIVLSSTNVTEPEYAVRYFPVEDIDGSEYWVVEFYDNARILIYEGQLSSLQLKEKKENLYGYCPLQIVPNNNEMLGDAEKVLAEIDAYDRVMSDSSNQIEGQVNSKEIYENVNITPEEIARGNYTGALSFHNGVGNGRIYNLEKNINDAFVEHHLTRLTENIYRFSRTPNLNDQAFGNATGVALKFKLTGLETKCGMFQAKLMSASVYMFKLLASAWAKKNKAVIDPLQCFIDCKRNFPLDLESEARVAQALIGAGLPKKVVYALLPFIDDVDYVMQIIEEEQSNIPSLEDSIAEDYEGEEEEQHEEEEENEEDNTK